jgi:beta-lactamase superfamily II metal-dependent hydrolase
VSLTRRSIGAATAATLDSPLDSVARLSGVRAYYVGQGDALGVLDDHGEVVFRVDYGGRQSNPFKPKARQVQLIDASLPVAHGRTLMLTHWDEDHWCSTRLGTKILAEAIWLVPRQLTSPRAVERSTKVATIQCIPESLVGVALKFETGSGDAVWCEKLGRFEPHALSEDCNATGVAFAVTTQAKDVILLPGDAPYHLVNHYGYLKRQGYRLRGLVAYHHGANTHWEQATYDLLKDWPASNSGQVVLFSYGQPNAYGHPHRQRYKVIFPNATIKDLIAESSGAFDLRF